MSSLSTSEVIGSKRAVFLSHLSFNSPFRVGSHQLVSALSRLGWSVFHAPIPITPVHLPMAAFNRSYRERVLGALVQRRIYERSFELIPFSLIPWQLARVAGEKAADLYASVQPGFRNRVNLLGFETPDILFIDEPRLSSMARYFKPSVTIYRAVDLYSEMKNDQSLRGAEKAALKKADGFIATSQPVYERMVEVDPTIPGLLLENGVELQRFNQRCPEPEDLASIPHPRAIYVGDMDGRFDFKAIAELAAARPGISIVLIGPISPPVADLALKANVYALGTRPYEKVAAYLQHAEIGLLPLSAHPANRGRSPMKIYEYGAAGLPVLATETPEMRRRNLPFVFLYDSADQMAAIVDRCLREREILGGKAVECANKMSWEGRLEQILEFATKIQKHGWPAATKTT